MRPGGPSSAAGRGCFSGQQPDALRDHPQHPVCSLHVSLHGSLPERRLQGVEAGALEAAKVVDLPGDLPGERLLHDPPRGPRLA